MLGFCHLSLSLKMRTEPQGARGLPVMWFASSSESAFSDKLFAADFRSPRCVTQLSLCCRRFALQIDFTCLARRYFWGSIVYRSRSCQLAAY